MKNGFMPCRQQLSNCILVHLGVIAVLILTFLCRNNLTLIKSASLLLNPLRSSPP
jgi:hypothetical protein